MKWRNPKVGRIIANISADIFPEYSAKIIYSFWTQTNRPSRTASKYHCLRKAKQKIFKFDGKKVVIYTWGKAPYVLLLHGWNGCSGQYCSLIEELVGRGYSVMAFDAPGHGESTNNSTSLRQWVHVIQHLHHNYGEFNAIVGHSFGFIAAVNALYSGVKSKAMIGISSPSDFNLLVKAFIASIRLNSKAANAFTHFLKKRYRLSSFKEISVHYLAKELDQPCLMVHDENDKQVPVSEAQKITNSWKNAELLLLQNGGHTRILRDNKVVSNCVSFLERNISK